MMTMAEALEKRGAEKASIRTAIILLEEGVDQALIARATKLDLDKIKALSAQLKNL